MKNRIFLLMALMLSALPAFGQTFTYTMPGPGFVSGSIYNASGQLVKQLRWGTKDTAVAFYSTGGAKSFAWNGLDNDGVAVPNPTTCTYRILYRPQQLTADYLMSPGNSFPRGPSWWETAVCSHSGIRSVAGDATGLYMGGGISESVTNGAKFSLDMNTRIWSAWQPGSFMGRWSTAVMGGQVYFLQANGWIAWHGTSTPNPLYWSVGRWQANGTWVGKRANISWSTPQSSQTTAWVNWPGQNQDMAARGTTIAMSYQANNAVRFYNTVGATDVIRDTTITVNGAPKVYTNVYYWTNLPVIRTVTHPDIVAPKGIAFALDGSLLVCSGNRILRVTTAGAVTTFSDGAAQGFTNPYRVTVAPDGEVFVGCGAPQHQIVRLSSSGVRNRDPYGRNGGREYGLYVPRNFKGITDLEPHPSGGFLVVEGVPPHRIVWIDETTGEAKKDLVGAGCWMPSGALNPLNPSEAWVMTEANEVMRIDMNYATNTWRVHSTFKTVGSNSLINARFTGADEGLGGGFGDWAVKVYRGEVYLCRREYRQILRYDRKNNTLKPIVVADLASSSTSSYVWTDANGDGQVQSSERVTGGSESFDFFHSASSEAPGDFSYFHYQGEETADGSLTDGGQIRRWKHTGFSAAGAPLFQSQTVKDIVVASIPGVVQDKYYARPAKHPQISCTDGKTLWLFEQVQEANDGWGESRNGSIRLYRMNPTGAATYIGKVGKWMNQPAGTYGNSPAPPAGYQYVFKNMVGSVYEVAVATDFNGGFSGSIPAITYAYHGPTGGYVGGLFQNFVLTGGKRSHDYSHNGDNGTGRIYPEYKTGEALYIAGGSADTRVYRISGWKGWKTLTGSVQ